MQATMKRRLGHYDIDTGEMLEHLNVVAVTPRKRNGFGMSWLALSQDARERIDGLGLEAIKVLFYLLSVMEYENRVIGRKVDMARALGIGRANFQRAFRKLENCDLVRPGEINGTYTVSPELAWRGSGRNHIIALDQFRRGKE